MAEACNGGMSQPPSNGDAITFSLASNAWQLRWWNIRQRINDGLFPDGVRRSNGICM